MAERVIRLALDFQDSLVAAGLADGLERSGYLKQADRQLAQLRQQLRLCQDLAMLSLAQYEHAARMLVEIGRLLGGWRKSHQKTGQADGSPGGAGRLVERQS